MSNTRVRDSERMLILLDMLQNRFDHPTAQECYLDMVKKVPGIGRSTVYRHLAKLADNGLILELHMDEGPARFDASTQSHAHFYCKKCNKMLDVMDAKTVGTWPGKIEVCSFIAKGVCNDCIKIEDKS